MDLKLKQIFLPNPNPENKYVTYENQLQPRMEFSESYLKELYEKHYNDILQIVKEETENYLNDDDLCNDDEDMFPRRCEMTGEWYIGDVDFEDDYLRICVNFLGTVNDDENYIDDYLELEVGMYYEDNRFIFDGINSACI